VNIKTTKTDQPLTFGLAMAGGIGLTLMIVALAVGVIGGEGADSSAISLTFLLGVGLLILGIGGWMAVTRPFEHFDDIDQPADGGHGHAHAAHDDHAAGSEHPAVEAHDAPKLPAGETNH
jgi:ABC-type nickel/cobalt efflux system permease component RcnA